MKKTSPENKPAHPTAGNVEFGLSSPLWMAYSLLRNMNPPKPFSLLSAVVLVAPVYANEPAEVRELAANYKTFRNEKKYDELIANCLCRERVTDAMLQATKQVLGFGVSVESFKIEKATDQDKKLFLEGAVFGDQGRLYSNLDPAWVIVFTCAASGNSPASTERVAVGQDGDKWRISMLAPKKN